MRAIVAAISLSLAASAFAQVPCDPGSLPCLSDPKLVRTDYLAGFSAPTGIRFIGPDEGFVIEKGGAVKYFASGAVSTALSLTVASNSERGLLGIALDPAFTTNGHVYLYHSAGSGSAWSDNRVTRYTWNAADKKLEGESLVRIFGTSANGEPDGPNHNGGTLTFGPDGKLYGATGDLRRDGVEQNNRATAASAFSGGAVLVGEVVQERLWLFRLNAARDGFVLEGGLADGVFDSGDPFAAFGEGLNITTDIQVVAGDAVYIATLGDGVIHRIAPIPEPSQWLLALAGLGVVGLVVQRKRRRQG